MILLSKNKAHKYALRFIYIYCRYLALRRYQKKNINSTVLKASTFIITSITFGLIGLATKLPIMIVSTFISVIILYAFPNCNLTCSPVKLQRKP